ncbi:MAG TPA: DUF1003 domain-containing protein [Longimicrobium sp.]|nr:DUF1003 domain-containing protein [Longimicrobium sp.]
MTHRQYAPDRRDSPQMAGVVERNIRALLARRQMEDREKALGERVADRITRFTGSMRFVYIHLVLFGAWIVVNLGWTPLSPFDPSFVVLAMVASVEAIFLSTFVLISQNRMQALADKRADLDLQVSLLAEHEITQLIALVTQMAHKMGIEQAADPELAELAQDVAPEKVLDEMEAQSRDFHAVPRREKRDGAPPNGVERRA